MRRPMSVGDCIYMFYRVFVMSLPVFLCRCGVQLAMVTECCIMSSGVQLYQCCDVFLLFHVLLMYCWLDHTSFGFYEKDIEKFIQCDVIVPMFNLVQNTHYLRSHQDTLKKDIRN